MVRQQGEGLKHAQMANPGCDSSGGAASGSGTSSLTDTVLRLYNAISVFSPLLANVGLVILGHSGAGWPWGLVSITCGYFYAPRRRRPRRQPPAAR